jgi:hypothetical protein
MEGNHMGSRLLSILRVLVYATLYTGIMGVYQCGVHPDGSPRVPPAPTAANFLLLAVDNGHAAAKLSLGNNNYVDDNNDLLESAAIGLNTLGNGSVSFGSSNFLPVYSSLWAKDCSTSDTSATGSSFFDYWGLLPFECSNGSGSCNTQQCAHFVRQASGQDPMLSGLDIDTDTAAYLPGVTNPFNASPPAMLTVPDQTSNQLAQFIIGGVLQIQSPSQGIPGDPTHPPGPGYPQFGCSVDNDPAHFAAWTDKTGDLFDSSGNPISPTGCVCVANGGSSCAACPQAPATGVLPPNTCFVCPTTGPGLPSGAGSQNDSSQVTNGLRNLTAACMTLPTVSPQQSPLVGFGDVEVVQKGELDLCQDQSATYYFRSLKLDQWARLRVGYPCMIYIWSPPSNKNTSPPIVNQPFVVTEFGSLGPNPGSTAGPSDIHVFCGDSGDGTSCPKVNIDHASMAEMDLLAPYAELDIGTSARINGRYIANYINGGNQVLMRRVPSGPGSVPRIPYSDLQYPRFSTLTEEDYGVDATVAGSVNASNGLIDINRSLGTYAIFPLTIGEPGIRALTIYDPSSTSDNPNAPMALGGFLPVRPSHAHLPGALCGIVSDPTTGASCPLCAGSTSSCPSEGSLPESDGPAQLGTQQAPQTPQFMTIVRTGEALDSTPYTDGNLGSGGQGAGTLAGQVVTAELNVRLSELITLGKSQSPPVSWPLRPTNGSPAPISADGTTVGVEGVGDFVIPQCICTDSDFGDDIPNNPDSCRNGRWINLTQELIQGPYGGLENGLTTVNDLIAFANVALSSSCSQSGHCGESACSTAFFPDDPIRVGEMEYALRAVNECFSGHVHGASGPPHLIDRYNCMGVTGTLPPTTRCCKNCDQQPPNYAQLACP